MSNHSGEMFPIAVRARRSVPAILLCLAAMPVHASATGPIRVCQHVPITGAAPIPHHPDRFGAFYFNAVNAEQGGIDGRPVEFRSYNDQYNPAGARDVFEKCQQQGAHLVLGPVGRDQMASVSRAAEEAEVPYLHGAMARADTAGLTWSGFLGPTDEEQMGALADMIIGDPAGFGVDDPNVGIVHIASPYHDAGRDALESALDAHGKELAADVAVHADETDFQDTWFTLETSLVNVVVFYATLNVFAKMMNQRPLTYGPAFASIASDLGSNIAASAGNPLTLVTLHDPSPVYDPDDETLPWHEDIDEFLRIFEQYSPQQQPRPDDIDWAFYLRAKQIHRFLDARDGDVSPDAIRGAMASYTETPEQAFPACALDFAIDPLVGSHAWHVFRAENGRWTQAVVCASESARADLTPPVIDCGALVQIVTGRFPCRLTDPGSGIGSYTVHATGPLAEPTDIEGDGECERSITIEVFLPLGLHDVAVGADNCGTSHAGARALVLSAGG